MDLCKKTAQILLNSTYAQTTTVDLVLIDDIRSELKRIQDKAKFLFAEQDSIAMQLSFLKDQIDIARDPTCHIELRLFEILNLNEPETFNSLMLCFLEAFKKTCQSQITKQYIQEFIDIFSKKQIINSISNYNTIDTIHAIDNGIDELLYILARQKSNQTECEKLFEFYSSELDIISNKPMFQPQKRQDKIAIKALTKSKQKLLTKLKHNQSNLLKLYQELSDYKHDRNINFEFDPAFNLTRILVSSKTQTKEILFLNCKNQDNSMPYAEYENSPIRFISAGNFGTIKVCQNLNTNMPHAIVIQEGIISSPLTETGEDPHFQQPFSRNLNCLLQGVDLSEHIEKGGHALIENRLNIARQTALILYKITQENIQIIDEITPMNFIWDDIKKQLYFCYLALHPHVEINKANPGFINILGKLCQALFKAVDELPPLIQKVIDDLLSSNKTQSLELQQVAKQLDNLFIRPSIYLKNGN